MPSEKGTFSAVSRPSKGHNERGELKKRGTISVANGRKRALLTNSALEWTIKDAQHNQRCVWTAKRAKQNKKPCVTDNKNCKKKRGQGIISAF